MVNPRDPNKSKKVKKKLIVKDVVATQKVESMNLFVRKDKKKYGNIYKIFFNDIQYMYILFLLNYACR